MESCGLVDSGGQKAIANGVAESGESINSNDSYTEDKKFLIKRQKRNDAVFQIMFSQFKKQIDQNLIRFLDIFVNVTYFKRYYQSYYNLLQIKNKCVSGNDQSSYFYLRMLVLQKIKEGEKDYKKEIFKIDKAIEVDQRFQEYKRLVYNTSLTVERFWIELSKKEYSIIDAIHIGDNIVDEYLKIKDIFDGIIKAKPDFKEAVLIHLNFNGEVMNFEMEALQFSNMLKNIQQKLQITKQNQYLQRKERQGLILVSGNPLKKYKILLINQIACKLLGYNSLQITGKELNFIIPTLITQIHDKLVERFLTGNHNRYLKTDFRRLWFKTYDNCILPAKIEVQTCVSEKSGITLAAFVDIDSEVVATNFSSKFQDAFFILTNELGYIINVSKNFKRKFLKIKEYAIDDLKINVEDFILGLSDHNEEELKQGVKLQMISNFYGLNSNKDSIRPIDILLIANTYHLPKQIIFREYVFSEIKIDVMRQTFVMKSIMEVPQLSDSGVMNGVHFGEEEDSSLDHNDMQIEFNTSSESGSSRSAENAMQKGAIDFKQTPPSLVNLRRAILLFFFTLIATSFSVLAVALIQNNDFLKDSQSVESSIYLGARQASMRCAFRLLINSPKGESTIDFYYLQNQIENYFNKMQIDLNVISDENTHYTHELKQFMEGDNVNLQYLMSDGSKTQTVTTYSIASQTFLSKIKKFSSIDKQQFKNEFANYYVSRNYSSPTVNQRDAYFIIMNGMYDLRSFTLKMGELYINQAQTKEETYDVTVIVICIVCIVITIAASVGLIPITFQLDTEQQSIVNQWMNMSQSTKQAIVQRIDNFLLIIHDEEEKKKKNKSQKSFTKDEIDFGSIMGGRTVNNNNNQIENNMIFDSNSMAFDKSSVMQENYLKSQSQFFADQLNKKFKSNEESKLDFPSFMHNKSAMKPKLAQINELQESDEIYFQQYNTHKKLQNTNEISQYNNKFYNQRQSPEVKVSEIYDSQTNIKIENVSSSVTQSLQEHTNQQQKIQNSQDEITSEEIRYQQKHQLIQFYRKRKLQKILIIALLCTTIVAFYIAFYFIANNVFHTASVSYEYLQTVNRRTPCLINVYNFLLETFSQNTTVYIGYEQETPFTHAQRVCLAYEQSLKNYDKIVPPQLKSINSIVNQMNSKELCSIVFGKNDQELNECLNYGNGLLQKGLHQVFQTMYYHLFTEYVSFDSFQGKEYERTQQYIESHMFLAQTQQYLYMIYKYIIPSTDYMSKLYEDSLKSYLDKQIQVFMIVFSLFLVFLLFSLTVSLRFVLTFLKKTVFRSRVLVKIIPADELSEINKRIRREKHHKPHKD